jgi:hypothetical protein
LIAFHSAGQTKLGSPCSSGLALSGRLNHCHDSMTVCKRSSSFEVSHAMAIAQWPIDSLLAWRLRQGIGTSLRLDCSHRKLAAACLA